MGTNGAHSILVTQGATCNKNADRQKDDYYATDPIALELLLDLEPFSANVWECACGEGNLSKVLEKRGYNVTSTDLVDRGYGAGGVDFLGSDWSFDGDIITNPPYKYAKEFAIHAIESVTDGHKVAMFLKLQFLEGASRRELFNTYPPKIVYVSTSRINCYKDGIILKNQRNHGAQAYAWFVWEKPFVGDTVVKWFN